MKKRYPYTLNLVIAILSMAMGVLYVCSTMPMFITQLKCATCGDITMLSFQHYWYRWCLYALLIFAGYRLLMRLLGARRLYYVFFIGATVIAILDSINNFRMMSNYDIALDIIIPIVCSIIGVIYFQLYYLSSLKNR